MSTISRTVPSSVASDLFLLATYILSIPRVQTEALVVFPGMGEDERVIHAIDRWRKDDFSYLLVAGLNLKEKTARTFDLATLCQPPFNLSADLEDGVYAQVDADNTLTQAQWTAKMVKKFGIKSLTITTPAYHLPRAYLTLLKQSLSVKCEVALIPDATPSSPLAIVPELNVPAWQMAAGEAERIVAYQKKGDIATRDELLEYLSRLNEWMEDTETQ